jgi:MSHA biogenesis protein MshL
LKTNKLSDWKTAPAWQGLSLAGLLALSGCAAPPAPPLSAGHIKPTPVPVGKPLDFVTAPALPKPPRPVPRQEIYSVSVQQVNVQELLFALARDARLNIDIHPAIQGVVTMNVRDQTMLEILDRIAKQVDLRYEIQGANVSIMPDIPYLKHYRIDYPNIQRETVTSISTSTNVASTGSAPGESSGGSGSNASTSSINNTSNNRFWETLIVNVRDLLRETDKVLPGTASTASAPLDTAAPAAPAAPAAGASAIAGGAAVATSTQGGVATSAAYREAASVIANAETGIMSVRAKQNQHAKVAEFIDRVMQSARRQVLIEATIVEVDLSTRFQQGIDWSLLRAGGAAGDPGFVIRPAGPSSGLQTGGVVSSLVTLTRRDANFFDGRDLTVMLSMLESFGNLRVLSSPKISVLNNQSSVLKVVDNKVYFNLEVTPGTPATATTPATPASYSTKINTVPIGFLMTVTPQVSEADEITLNLRPTISRITGYASDPNPVLSQNQLVNRIPEVQTREMESLLRVRSGGVAILGGLMQDSRSNNSDEVPGLNRLPMFGNLFKFRDEGSKKTELVIFLRPTVLNDNALGGSYSQYHSTLQGAIDGMADKPSRTALEWPRTADAP